MGTDPSKNAKQSLRAQTQELLGTAVDALGGATHQGQQTMADKVIEALQTERHLAIQAGTGTGKSLAYLVPALLYAATEEATVIVSTATLALQRQLIERDLPRLASALGPHMQRTPTFAIMKGRSNYLCLHKVSQSTISEEALVDTESLGRLGQEVAQLHAWAQETETGDRDDLDGVRDLAWRQVSVTAQECVGATNCPHAIECFAEKAKDAAKDVDVVVTNHAMLAIDALSEASILPDHRVVIIDEAHELDGRITAVATSELSPIAINLLSKRLDKINESSGNLQLALEQWESTITKLPAGRLLELPHQLAVDLLALLEQCSTVRQGMRNPDGEATSNPERYAERQAIKNVLSDYEHDIVRILDVFSVTKSVVEGQGKDTYQADPLAEDVAWIEHDPTLKLKVAPLSVKHLLQHRLFAHNTVVLTSATLSLGGNFQAMASSWGMPAGTWDGFDVGTPFDPARSGILYTPTHLPQPGREGLSQEVIEEIYQLIMAAGGRTLGLFSSRRAAQQAAEELRKRLPFDVLCQGDESTASLVRRFSKQENTCLFGTLGLWQGVDVPGKSCSLVIIDRIPFPRPDNPLLAARKDSADASGRNGFMEVAATHAALLLAQGAGRLLRRVDDRGVVAIMDPRLVQKRYGSFLLRSLPAFWRTDDPHLVRGALTRLVRATN